MAGLDADHLRRGLHAWKEQARREPSGVGVEAAIALEPEPLRRASGE